MWNEVIKTFFFLCLFWSFISKGSTLKVLSESETQFISLCSIFVPRSLSLSRLGPGAVHACEHFIILWGVVLLSPDIDLTVTEGLFKRPLRLQSPWVTISILFFLVFILVFCLWLQMHPSLTFTTSTVTSIVWWSVGVKQNRQPRYCQMHVFARMSNFYVLLCKLH